LSSFPPDVARVRALGPAALVRQVPTVDAGRLFHEVLVGEDAGFASLRADPATGAVGPAGGPASDEERRSSAFSPTLRFPEWPA
jgi:hypothetical protein